MSFLQSKTHKPLIITVLKVNRRIHKRIRHLDECVTENATRIIFIPLRDYNQNGRLDTDVHHENES
jgi:hypothetical protein